MSAICFYFQVHQPYRLRHYSVFEIGKNHFYDDVQANCDILLKVAKKCYLPMNALLLNLIKKHNGKFKIAFSISGTALRQFEEYAPEVIESFKDLAKTGCVEFLAETYAHSLSFLYSEKEFKKQVKFHSEKIKELFNYEPQVFRNTELIYNNDLAHTIEKMKYKAVLAEGADHILGWRSPNYLYQAANSKTKLLLKNYKLSDDIAFRFSNQGWEDYPLTADKYTTWIKSSLLDGDVINLFMDYETFGEHQWEDTGIFNFMQVLPEYLLNENIKFLTPSEVVETFKPVAMLDVPQFVSWADAERDLTAWLGNDMQNDAINALYNLEKKVHASGNKDLEEVYMRLQTSDHFYYMCTKWFSDGDVHKYFNSYNSPYDAYINYMNVLTDFENNIK